MKRLGASWMRVVAGALVATAVGTACGGSTSGDVGGGTHFQCKTDAECVAEFGESAECFDEICHPSVAAATQESGSAPDSGTGDPEGVAAGVCPSSMDSCWECGCESCAAEWDACMADEQCKAMMECAEETGAPTRQFHVIEPCKIVVEAAGGIEGDAYATFVAAFHTCTANAACPCAVLGPYREVSTNEPLEGVEICAETDPPQCDVTDRNGIVKCGESCDLSPPPSEEVLYTQRKDGYVSLLLTWRSPIMFTPETVESWASRQGVTWDDSKGLIKYDVDGGGQGFDDARLDPPSGTFTTVILAGPDSVGSHAWNVDPGFYDLIVEHPTMTCPNTRGPDGTTPGSSLVEARAGFITVGGRFECQ